MVSGQADLSEAVRAARGGSESAFRLLYREVQPGLLRYLRGLLPAQDAEDIASEAWLQIARDIRTFRDEGAGFRGWAATIARHRAMDHLRAVQRRPATAVSDDLLVGVPDGNDTADLAVTATATNATVAFIATLPHDQAEAVLLRVVMGLDAAAVAKVMGKRPGAVRTATWRGLRTLSERLRPAREAAIVRRSPRLTPRKTG